MLLRSKMLLVWGGFVLLLWAGTLWPVQRTLDATFSRLTSQEFEGTRQGLRALQDERVKRMRQASSLVMNIPELRALIAEHNYELEPSNLTSLEERLDALAKTLGAGFVCVLDNRGNVIAQNQASPWPTVAKLHSYMDRHAEAASLVNSIYAPNRPAGDVYGLWATDTGLMQAVGVPLVFDADDTTQAASATPDGALVIATPITNELANQLASSHNCELTFFTGQHVAATSISDARLIDQLAALLRLKQGEQAELDGITYRIYSETLKDPCSGTAVGQMLVQSDQRDAQAVHREMSRTLLAILGTGLTVMALGSYFISGAITRPILQLLRGVNRVAGGDLSLSLSTNRRDELGQLAAAFNDMVRQIAMRRELERQVEETKAASKAKSLFLANMSHEIRTPLNGVIGMADLMLSTELSERQRRYAGLVKSSAEVLTTLVNDTLDFAKMEAGKMELEALDFDLHTVIEEVVEMFAPKAHKKGLIIICDIAGSVRRAARGDPNRLRQVINNLLNNAIKFTDQGEIAVRAEPDPADPSLVRIAISDTGIGIPQDRLDRLFKAFSQVDASTTRRFGGTGLGLVICKQLAELMGGSIGLHSEAGKGSTFWFTAKIAAAEQLLLPPIADPKWRGMKLLLAEAAPSQRAVLSSRLTEWGFDVVTAGTEGELAAEISDGQFQHGRFQLAIIGKLQPDRSPAQSAQLVAERIPSLVLLRSDQEISPDQLRETKLRGYVTQPLRQIQLARAIASALLPSDSQQPIASDATSSEPATRSSIRILVADDHDVNQLVVGHILEQSGFGYELVSDGRQACTASAQEHFDLILMDCQMPEVDGFEAAREIRRREQRDGLRRIPIVALTANNDAQDRQRCLDAGMDDFCTKPIDRHHLVSTVQKLLLIVEPTVPENGAAPVDWETVLRRCSGKPALAEKVLAKLGTQAQAALDAITTSLASGDAAAVARLAHGLKGTAGMASASDLQTIAGQLEAIGKSADLQLGNAAVDRLKAEIDRCNQFIADSSQRAVSATTSNLKTPSTSKIEDGD
jgi:signal transduction histidine kinase/CheY-like chemotaxis protein/HPt (histidine-containing phosphotransfer) domain-containing protein